MPIGQKVGSMKALKQSLQKGGSGSTWIKYIPKNGSMNVRFIQEPEEWVNYVEHYDQTLRKSYPCNGEASCPGCVSGERKSYRYLANAVDLDSNDRVIPLQLPKDLANRLVVKYEKWGTLIDRDIELTRQGEGLDTVYDLDPGLKDNRKIDKFQSMDLLKVLDDAFTDVFGGGVDPDDETPPAAPTAVKKRVASKAVAALHADDDPEPETPAPLKAVKRTAAVSKVAEPVFTPEVDDPEDDPDLPDELKSAERLAAEAGTDDKPDADDEADDDEGYTQEQLEALPLGALRAVARDFEVDVKGKSAAAIIAEIMSSGEEDA